MAEGIEQSGSPRAVETVKAGADSAKLGAEVGAGLTEGVMTRDTLREDRELREEMLDKAKNEIKSILKEGLAENKSNPRVSASITSSGYVLAEPAIRAAREWEIMAGQMMNNGASVEDFLIVRETYVNRMNDTVSITRDFIMDISHGRITKDILLAIEDMSPKVVAILKQNDPKLMATLQWSLGVLSGDDKGKAIDNADVVARNYMNLSEYMTKGGIYESFAWTILDNLEAGEKVDFIKNYFAKARLDDKGKIAFLERGNIRGTLGILEMEELYPGGIPQNKVGEYAAKYQLVKDYLKKAERIFTPSMGASNYMADEAFTGKNMLLGLLELGAYTTVAANIGIGLTKGGWKNPMSLIHEYTVGGTALAVGARHLRKGDQLGETFADEETRKSNAEIEGRRNFAEIMQTEWNTFFKNEDSELAFADFVQKTAAANDNKLPEKGLADMFLTFLKGDSQYEELARKFQNMKSNGIDESEMHILGKTFTGLDIKGSREDIENKFAENMEVLKGKSV